MKATYNKDETLKSNKAIEQLFRDGKSVSAYPLRLVYHKSIDNLHTGVSVSKRNFKHAVDRNRIKRLLREAYRLNKHLLYEADLTDYNIMIIYNHKDMPDFNFIEEKTKAALQKFITKLTAQKTT